MNVRLALFAALVSVLVMPARGFAHEAATVELTLDPSAATITVEADAVDLDFVAGLRAGGGGALTVAHIRENRDEISNYVAGHIDVAPCEVQTGPARIGVRQSRSPRVVVDYPIVCPGEPATMDVASRLFSMLPGYRTLLTVAGSGELYVLGEGGRTIALDGGGTATRLLTFVTDGVHHILVGFDHLLFLLLLVLPLSGRGGTGRRFVAVLSIVTAFTVAHSITLSLSTLGHLALPARPVELLIAASVVIVAAANLAGRMDRLAWPFAYGFGLIHGFGFAGAFGELAAGRNLGWMELAAFNIGVEIGQIAVIAVALYLLHLLAARRTIARAIVPVGSAAAAAIGLLWIVQRL